MLNLFAKRIGDKKLGMTISIDHGPEVYLGVLKEDVDTDQQVEKLIQQALPMLAEAEHSVCFTTGGISIVFGAE